MGFTNSQLEAIKYEGTNILVSASAGSGKTGVLKERVINKIKNGVDIDQLVILTFTKSAAEEMKTRIIKELDSLKLENQIARVDNAIISTFDAFTLRLVSEYHYLLGLEKNIQINDSVLIKLKKQEIINNVLKDYFINNEADFNQFFKKYFSKSDNWLYEIVYKIGETFRKIPNYLNLIEEYQEQYLKTEFIEKKARIYLETHQNNIAKYYEEFKKENLDNIDIHEIKWQEYIRTINVLILNLLTLNGDDFVKEVINIEFPRKPSNKDLEVPEIVDLIKKCIKKEFQELYIDSIESMIKNYETTYNSVLVLLKIVKEYLSEFKIIQHEEGLFSYEDIMYYAIKLFQDFPDVKLKFKTKIHEILIDEYQDTNDLQDKLISLIADENVFMVGDVKQSIYRFRDANPKNFMRIYEDYLENNTGKAIFLQENFRSNSYLLEAINNVFTKVMTQDLGGVNYQKEQMLKTGYLEDHPLHLKEAFKVKIYNFDDVQINYPDLTKEELEAHLVAQNIIDKLDSKEEIYDLHTKKKRKIEYEDFCILVDRKKEFQTYSKVIAKYNIPIDIYDEEPFFSSDEIRFIFQFLLLINCFKNEEYFLKHFKTSLYAVARSVVYQTKDQVISNFFLSENVNSIADIDKLSKYEKLKLIYDDICNIIANYWDLPPGKILEQVYDTTNIYRLIASLENPRQKEEKLDFFLLKVKGFTRFSFQDLILYLEAIIETDDFDIEYSEVKKHVNAVKLMSMHKSKGLQFPIVYLIGLYKQFRNMENQDAFIFNKDYGIITKSYVEGFFSNFMQKNYFSEVDKENISEKVRLLYVAMTRAINQLYLIIDYDEKLILKNRKILSFKHLLYKTLDIDKEKVVDFKYLDFDRQLPFLEKSDDLILLERFNFENKLNKRVRFSKSIESFLDEDVIKLIDTGNEYHQLLERIDFFKIEETIQSFPEILKDSIRFLVNTKIFANLKNPRFFKEYEFYQDTNKQVYRGIIDLLIIDENQVIALDYKLKNIDDEAYYSQLRGYYKFLVTKIDKPINLYLYSLIDRVLKKVEL